MLNQTSKIKIKNFFNQTLVYLLIAYVFFILGRSIWLNFQIKKQLESTKSQISETEKKNKNLENLILYYQSDSFKEVEARQKLGLKKPGETVVAVPVKKYEDYNQETQAQTQEIVISKEGKPLPNWQLWWQYLFK